MTHSHDMPPGLGPLTSLTHTHDGQTHTHVRSEAPAGPPQRLHLRGVVLPEGEERDLWLHDGVISFKPLADAITIATVGWIMPGLVDAHCHVGLESHGAVSEERAEEHAITDREAGALLLRDAGSPLDTRFLQDRDDLPKIIRDSTVSVTTGAIGNVRATGERADAMVSGIVNRVLGRSDSADGVGSGG